MGLETGTATIIDVLEATSDEEDSLSSELNEFTLSSAEQVLILAIEDVPSEYLMGIYVTASIQTYVAYKFKGNDNYVFLSDVGGLPALFNSVDEITINIEGGQTVDRIAMVLLTTIEDIKSSLTVERCGKLCFKLLIIDLCLKQLIY